MRSDFQRIGDLQKKASRNGYSDISRFFAAKTEVREEDCIKECIENIIMTQNGERIFNPSFGCGLIQYIGEPHGGEDDEMLDRLLKAISYEEPRIEMFRSRSMVASDPINHTVRIKITYRILESGEVGVFDKTVKDA
jgi:phage baseplate assembly protein W